MPVLPSYRNQSIDLHNLAGFYMRVTLAFNGSVLEAKFGDDPKLWWSFEFSWFAFGLSCDITQTMYSQYVSVWKRLKVLSVRSLSNR